MARRKRNSKVMIKNLLEIVQNVAPHQILGTLSNEYRKYEQLAKNQAEYEYWMKCARATANLSSGMEKWLEEWIQEEEEEET